MEPLKILLVGEYSALHLNLKYGLEKLGHRVTLAADGDSWKKIQSDVTFNKKSKGIGLRLGFLRSCIIAFQLKDYDIVQFINPMIFQTFPSKVWFNRWLINRLIKKNKKSFLLAAGDDAMYYKDYSTKFRYSPHQDHIQHDAHGKEPIWMKPKFIRFNQELCKRVSGIIPIMYDYKIGYQNFFNCKRTIPIPLDTSKIVYQENIPKDKVILFHGLNREGFKGTKYIREALLKIQKEFPKEVEVIIDGKMPFKEYLSTIQRTNIIIDQALSYSYGVNAVIAMAMGKLVMSGAEPECLEEFGLRDIPIVNISPNPQEIYEKIKNFISNKDSITKIGKDSRKFVEHFHESTKIAEQYLEVWSS